MATPVYPPTTTTNLLINTRTAPKIVYLPAASTIVGGKLYFVKDICGNAANSSIFLSTTGLDTFENRFRPSTLYALMSTNFQAMLLASDGSLNWMILQNYNANAILRSANFIPSQISGLAMWFDASDTSTMTFSGSTVTQWRDKSTNGRNANQNTGATFSSNSLVFTGSQSYTLVNGANLYRNVYFAIFVVERLTGAGYFMGDSNSGVNSGSLHVGYRTTTNLTFAFWNADLEITSISGTGVSRIWSFVLPSTGNRFVNLNGSLIGTYTNNTFLNSMVAFQIGCAFSASFYNGSLFEMVGYAVNLTTAQIQQVEGYLAWKWGLQGNLPASHPYKNAPP